MRARVHPRALGGALHALAAGVRDQCFQVKHIRNIKLDFSFNWSLASGGRSFARRRGLVFALSG